ncbi:hydrolase, CocE/NonD family protein [Plesiocystis pacifica SIR-1]|uniref:Hydrolase, CocE/NonD family protein n=1 Tax=Plesiocystis pacifica SIR-1 TaxID=391625 RepID=A6FYF3_9BACT|nr:hydrolase, CocE/NonD family protein [Plesiocystis pacifica SIR-1]
MGSGDLARGRAIAGVYPRPVTRPLPASSLLSPALSLPALFALSGLGCALTCAGCTSTTPPPVTASPVCVDADPAEEAPAVALDAEAQAEADEAARVEWIRGHYDKREVRIPMRDGKTLFTAVYTPKASWREALDAELGEGHERLPILLFRTPYRVAPYGEDEFPAKLGPHEQMLRDGYIFAYQDVRGRFMSEGEFVNMTPHVDDKKSDADIDESSDTFDTVEWLLANVEGHNGRVGQWGISYPGFYSAAGMVEAHPALVAVSPQAPIADWWYDDFHHNGAFFLPHLFNFIASFGVVREELTTEWPPRFQHGTPDGYQFFLDLGPVANANARHFHGSIPFWNEVVAHPNYDDFWQARNLIPHLREVAPAVLTVGGWYDAEDLYGPLAIHAAIERQDPDSRNTLVMGPWRHGGWARGDGDHLGDAHFGSPTSLHYRPFVERRFFAVELEHPSARDYAECGALPTAYVFETGAMRWRQFDTWPPKDASAGALYLGAGTGDRLTPHGSLVAKAPTERKAFESFTSDPAYPVPFTTDVDKGMTREYMTDDQRFASRRPDVLTYVSDPLDAPLTLAGPVDAQLWVSTSQRDADWVVKLIDVYPGDAEDHEHLARGQHMGGAQMMVRSEVLRGRFRDDPSQPKPFVPNKATELTVHLQDVLHTFAPGHRVMIQIQSTWFPLMDRNPQSWVENIYEAEAEDFVTAEHRVYRDAKHPSVIRFSTLPTPALDVELGEGIGALRCGPG